MSDADEGATSWEVDELIRKLSGSGQWTLWYFGDRQSPDALAGVRKWAFIADVVVLRGADRAAAWRTPLSERIDPFMPDEVLWHYLGNVRHTLRAMLTLEWDGPFPPLYPAPAECVVPESKRTPYRIRPPHIGA